jgi:hypothetical protein
MDGTGRGALASDDAQQQRGEDPTFRVGETSDWKKHAADLDRAHGVIGSLP